VANDVQSLQTASKKIRYLGAAKSGVGAARAMHLTSVALIPLGIGFVWILLSLIGKDYGAVHAELGHLLPAVVMILFVGASVYHMQLGMRVIIDDYIHDHHLKDWLLMANTFFCAVIGIASIYSLLKVGFSAV
jgi:succinate dehydrogenase / fumarate reductase, membrane anchor subunit